MSDNTGSPVTGETSAPQETTAAVAPTTNPAEVTSQPAATDAATNAATDSSADASTESAAPTTANQTSQPPAATSTSQPAQTQPTSQTSAAPASTSQAAPSSTAAAEPSSTSEPTTSAAQPTTTQQDEPTTTQAPSSSDEPRSTVITVTNTSNGEPQTSVVTITSTAISTEDSSSSTISATGTSTAEPASASGGGGGGLSKGSKVAIGVVVPIAAIAILALVGLFWWKKRRARMAAEEERRKEVEDYGYNPNADPTIPAIGMGGGDGAYEMREEGSSGYRGWGSTTLAGSSGRKASTTMSGGVAGQAYSDVTSPTTRGNMSDTRSGDALMDGPGSYSPEGEILGAMGPATANNRGGDVHRGPSNASSSYSAAARSDGSDGVGIPYGAGGTYYDQYAQNNPYSDGYGQGRQELPGQPIIRDNPARRNTRIENPSHYPQQSAGISQNF